MGISSMVAVILPILLVVVEGADYLPVKGKSSQILTDIFE